MNSYAHNLPRKAVILDNVMICYTICVPKKYATQPPTIT